MAMMAAPLSAALNAAPAKAQRCRPARYRGRGPLQALQGATCARASDAARRGRIDAGRGREPRRGRIRAGGQPSHLAGFVNSKGN